MLYAKYLPNWPSGTGEEVVCMVLPYMGMTVVKHIRTHKNSYTVSHQYCQIKYICQLFSANNILK